MSVAPKSQILKLADLVSYQEGSVVSRQISKGDAGNVTLFSFDAGQELSEHTSPFDALVHVLEGEVEIRVSGQSYALKVGEAIIMPASAPHAIKAITKFKMLLTMIRA